MTKKFYFLAIIFLLIFFSPLWAQTPTDADHFVREGISCYNQGLLHDAKLEFENALLLDKNNFEARIWLAQIYTDLKLIPQASILLREAASQAPDHPKVMQLTTLLDMTPLGRRKGQITDPVVGEIIDDLSSNEQLRPFGLVIPEDKISIKNAEITFALDGEREVDDYFETSDSPDYGDLFKENTGPLAEVLRAEKNQGMQAAMDLYMDKLKANPRLAAENDEGLLGRALDMFYGRFERSPEVMENRFYYGALLYINGGYNDAEMVLRPLKGREGRFASRLRPIFAALDAWKKAEEERIMMAKKAEEEKRRLEALARERERNKKVDVWDELKKKRAGISGTGAGAEVATASGDDNPSEKAIAAVLHTQGYDLYKKGKLNEAIEKYNACLERDDKNFDCVYHLGLAWTDKGLSGEVGAFDRAISYFRRVVSEDAGGKYTEEANSMIRDITSAKQSMGE
jgi:tetratricopeptide (TPR) repeat protein